MTLAVPGTTPLSLSSRAPSIVVVGADALLGALPATPVQLAHACLRAGFQHVVPASWGDELVAGAALRLTLQHQKTPVIQCSCPLVAHRLLSVGTDLRPFLVSLVPPPVALARYLRALYGAAQLHITYIGRCPGANDESIDARMVPEDLFELFREQNIVVEHQPAVFDSVIPPDRRRYFSQPGGVPTADKLWSSGGARTLVEVSGDDLSIELAQILLSEASVFVDLAPALGCVCSGRTGEHDVAAGRSLLASLEPPRASTPVVDTHVAVVLEVPLQAPTHALGGSHGSSGPTAPPSGRGAELGKQSVMPPPSLPYHSEVEPPHEGTAEASDAASAVAAPLFGLDDFAADVVAEPTMAHENQHELFPVPAVEDAAEDALTTVSIMEVTEETLAYEAPDDAMPAEVPDDTTGLSGDATEIASEIAMSEDPSSFSPEDVARSRAPKRRSPVHGVSRGAQSDLPKARDAAGRSLPRAYASHRRLAERLTEIAATRSRERVADTPERDPLELSGNGVPPEYPMADPVETEPAAPVLAPEEATSTTADAEATSVPTRTSAAPKTPDSIPLAPISPAHSAATPVADPVLPSLATSAPTVIVPVSAGDLAVDTPDLPRSPMRAAGVTRHHEHERPVMLPVERLSDRSEATPVRDGLDDVRTAEATVQPAPQHGRSWTLLVVIALVALVSSAAGIAIGAWYMSHRG